MQNQTKRLPTQSTLPCVSQSRDRLGHPHQRARSFFDVLPLAGCAGIKRLKPLLLKRIVDEFNMTQCIIFCRTNLDCDNLEKFLIAEGGGTPFRAGAFCCVLWLSFRVCTPHALTSRVSSSFQSVTHFLPPPGPTRARSALLCLHQGPKLI